MLSCFIQGRDYDAICINAMMVCLKGQRRVFFCWKEIDFVVWKPFFSMIECIFVPYIES